MNDKIEKAIHDEEEQAIKLENTDGIDILDDDEDIPCIGEVPDNTVFIENLIPMDTSNLEDVEIPVEPFKQGVADVAYLCGAISALVNVGINPNRAMDYVVEKQLMASTMEHNLKVAEIQKESSVESAKYGYSNKADMSMVVPC